MICIKNTGYPAALELRKLYESLPDPDAEETGMVRVIDESGEDYLYPSAYFAAVDLPESVEEAVLLASA